LRAFPSFRVYPARPGRPIRLSLELPCPGGLAGRPIKTTTILRTLPMKFSRTFTALAAAAALTVSFAAQAREYSVSTVLSDAFPWGQAAAKWAELVNERSEGRIPLRVYDNAQLVAGDQTKEFSAMRSGLIDMAVGSTINWSPQVQEGRK